MKLRIVTIFIEKLCVSYVPFEIQLFCAIYENHFLQKLLCKFRVLIFVCVMIQYIFTELEPLLEIHESFILKKRILFFSSGLTCWKKKNKN